MCGLCAALNASRNWTDASGKQAFTEYGRPVTTRLERDRRVTIINHIIGLYGLTIVDWGGSSYLMRSNYGGEANVYNLGGIWASVDELMQGAQSIDPLDPKLIDHLELLASVSEAQ
jgi:hypothetical protein